MILAGTLIEKLRNLESLHASTAVDGEREAARHGAERIREDSLLRCASERWGVR